jgi:VacB/RNase II family 3'-5' exoribonuclease
MTHTTFDLSASARDEMLREGFNPDFPPGATQQIAALRSRPAPAPDPNTRDLRQLLWSSIDNDTSRDLDQIEAAARADGGIRILIGIADVDSSVEIGSPIDRHASEQTTSVYTGVQTFPMLPEELSTDLTSLNESADRAAIVVEMLVAPDGSIASSDIYRALVRNRAQLTYNGVGPWLEGSAPAPAKVAASADLQAQLKLQDEAAGALRQQRHRLGALWFDRVEAEATIIDGHVKLAARRKNRASDLIEDFMIAANVTMERRLTDAGVSSIRRVVRVPERWSRIVELARASGENLPAEPDSKALSAFLQKQSAADPVHYPDLSLAVIKLLGPGEYVLSRPGGPQEGHFGLAAHDYTHSTAPNRRFADMVTQRLIKATLAKLQAPYADAALESIAQNCTTREDAARKVERTMTKRIAAVAMQSLVGQSFSAVVTGVTAKGVFVRVLNPPVEGRLMHGEANLDVGDRVKVTLVNADPERGFIDFSR